MSISPISLDVNLPFGAANAGTAIAIAITQAIARVRKRLLSFFIIDSSNLKELSVLPEVLILFSPAYFALVRRPA